MNLKSFFVILVFILMAPGPISGGASSDWSLGDSLSYSYTYLLQGRDNTTGQLVVVESLTEVNLRYVYTGRNGSKMIFDVYLGGELSTTLQVDDQTSLTTSGEDLHLWTDTSSFEVGQEAGVEEQLVLNEQVVTHGYTVITQRELETSKRPIPYWELLRSAFNHSSVDATIVVLDSVLRLSEPLGVRVAESFGLQRYVEVNGTQVLDTEVAWVLNLSSFSGIDLISTPDLRWLLWILVPVAVVLTYRIITGKGQ